MALGQSEADKVRSWAVALLVLCGLTGPARAADAPADTKPGDGSQAGAEQGKEARSYDVYGFQIEGVHLLSEDEVQGAVYDYLGPHRTAEDMEKARDALEKLYHAKGYQTVAVALPAQEVTDGVVRLAVTEGKVGRLRVRGSRYFSLEEIKAEAPSLAEGVVPNFNDVAKDIATLNAFPDRKVTPALHAGATPGTVDVDLNVEDSLPLHGSLELNNRYSQYTAPLRLDAMVRYDNLWQLGHSLSLTYEVAPQNPGQAEVYSASYLARIPGMSSLSLLLYGLKNDSNVATVGATNVIGRGEVIGPRAILALPAEADFYHSISLGFDFKHFSQELDTAGTSTGTTPITYVPVTAAYSATWQEAAATTALDASLIFNLRGLGSDTAEFDENRFDARGSFVYLKGDLSRSEDLPLGMQLAGKVQGQAANQPLVSSEQFSAGGLDTVRGYLESEVLGDNGWIGSAELRSPSLAPWLNGVMNDTVFDEWRFYIFAEGGQIGLDNALVGQQSHFNLASVGAGSRGKLFDHLDGSLDFGVPLVNAPATRSDDPRVTFRVWGEF